MSNRPTGTALRRFTDHKPVGKPFRLAGDHPSVKSGRTRFLAMLRDPRDEQRILKSGHHSRKIGKIVVKGRLAGMPIYTLTLEERKTCPSDCSHWLDCFGNKMHWSRRLKGGAGLETGIRNELAMYQRLHPDGFLVRLHVLGDFYSVAYVELWRAWLEKFPALHVFGYTAWQPHTAIGQTVANLRDEQWDRFAVRTSNGRLNERSTLTIDDASQAGDAIICPAQTEKTECCATCALCWGTSKNIAFLRH